MKQLFFLLLAIFFITTEVKAQEVEESLSLPRMVSLRSSLINARSGPGARYPIDWVYMQKSAPVEIVAEFELWRKVKDWDGEESWVHKAMLSSLRTVKIINLGENKIYKRPSLKSEVLALVEDGVVGEVKECPKSKDFCLISFGEIKGWIEKSNLFGIYPNEEI
ncbi:MAG: SH3 domain-containing protein [Alphaproteobacteria bacterium]